MLVYLDQNYASRIAKFLLGQRSHDEFGEVYRSLILARPLAPPSPFHVLETRGGYLLPTLKELFTELSQGSWLRHYQDVVRRQAARGGLDSSDLLCDQGDWKQPATLDPLEDLLELRLGGRPSLRREKVRELAARRFAIRPDHASRLPFFSLLGRLVAFRSADEERSAQPSDLTDLIMAATVAPYVDALATDRYLAEALKRVGYGKPLFSGRRTDVLGFADWLRDGAALPGE